MEPSILIPLLRDKKCRVSRPPAAASERRPTKVSGAKNLPAIAILWAADLPVCPSVRADEDVCRAHGSPVPMVDGAAGIDILHRVPIYEGAGSANSVDLLSKLR